MRWTTRLHRRLLAGGASPAGPPAPRPGRRGGPGRGARRLPRLPPSAGGVLAGPMATRAAERSFARRALGAEGERFFAQSCSGCHVAAATTATARRRTREGGSGRRPACAATGLLRRLGVPRPRPARGPRPLPARARGGGRGAVPADAPRRAPERGMTCGDCHTMRSLQEGRRSAKTCRDCHPAPSPDVPEHALGAHLEKMECEACHAAWAAQEYGTFLVRPATPEQEEAFAPLPNVGPVAEERLPQEPGRAAARPQRARPGGAHPAAVRPLRHRPAAAGRTASWPRSGSRSSPHHEARHGHLRRLPRPAAPLPAGADDGERLYELEKDGLPLRSFWSREKQTVVGGAFFPPTATRR
jgi:hypothetical protein